MVVAIEVLDSNHGQAEVWRWEASFLENLSVLDALCSMGGKRWNV